MYLAKGAMLGNQITLFIYNHVSPEPLSFLSQNYMYIFISNLK